MPDWMPFGGRDDPHDDEDEGSGAPEPDPVAPDSPDEPDEPVESAWDWGSVVSADGEPIEPGACDEYQKKYNQRNVL